MWVTLDRLGHRFEEGWLFRNLSVDLMSTSTAITGPSGVGKTTLLSIIGGLLSPVEGQVRFEGDAGVPPRIGWVFQTTNVFGNRSVFANLHSALVLIGRDAAPAETRAVDAATKLGLGDRLHTKARKLSGGEQQRLGIARAIAQEPPLILADEPTGQLDDRNSQLIIELLVANRPANSTVVVATHDRLVADQCEVEYRLSRSGVERVR